MSERLSGLKLVAAAQRRAYQRAIDYDGGGWTIGFGDDRGLFSRRLTVGGSEFTVEGYADCLPTYHGKKLPVIIESMLESRTEPLAVADVGCGTKARMLTDCRKRWGKRIRGIGISARMSFTADQITGMTEKEITIIQGDVQKLTSYIPPASVDMAACCFVMPYVADPIMTLVGVNEILMPGGIALISHFPLSTVAQENHTLMELLVNYLRSVHGFEVFNDKEETVQVRHRFSTEVGLSFTKAPVLELPISYTGRVQEKSINLGHGAHEESYPVRVLTYRFNISAMQTAIDKAQRN